MSESIDNPGTVAGGGHAAEATQSNRVDTAKSSISMHDGIGDWCDCCSCAAEPYWLEVAEELGIDLGGDCENHNGNR
jgi:hypothetical protein